MTRTYDFDNCNSDSIFKHIISDRSDLGEMPVTHKQDYFTAGKILESGKIEPTECDVFQKALVYFFYGRPSYHIAPRIGSRSDTVYLPVCFVLDAKSIHIDKIFPFDSGAFAKGMYDGFIHTKMDISLFSICPPTIESIKSFVNYFYSDNDQYYKNKSRPLDFSEFDSLELQAYINLLNNRGEEAFDERYSAIEVISQDTVMLADSIIAIVAPVDFKTRYEKQLRELKEGHLDIITYDTFGGAPNAYNAVIRDKLYSYFRKKGIVAVPAISQRSEV